MTQTSPKWARLAGILLAFFVAGSGCKKDGPAGIVNLPALDLGPDSKLSSDKLNPDLPPLGEEIFLVVTDLGTCLECKKAAIWVSNVWVNNARPKYLVYLDTIRSEFDVESTKKFIEEKKLRGLHYLCREECLEKLSRQLGETPQPPMHYFIGKSGKIHWKGGFLEAYAPALKAIRLGKHDIPVGPTAQPTSE